ncbi:putative concanavalin A-like lectin/glucanase domain-containing protein [Medicago truncatula]|uniref:Putative concanavalin A-like lectin/glucanase domain-containing protein n=1 Tax=Medicago truncatula TaxID=3880 RepID=A0A396JVK6_MEDTR|nr:putative concanavalin A-like lectin/glucanase domain-containing protein [Medicago truncatula]
MLSTGRILSRPLSLDNLGSFVTSFSFEIAENPGHQLTDGLIFFIAPQDTVIPPNSESQYFGVVDSKNAYNQFVGVEFDLYPNSFDPYIYHIGIDVNSIISTKIVEWDWEWVSESLNQVSIAYDSPSNTLSVVVIHANGKIVTIADIVDLKTVLPNTVRFGLSAASVTGIAHDIHSWSISTSELKTTTSSASNNSLFLNKDPASKQLV